MKRFAKNGNARIGTAHDFANVSIWNNGIYGRIPEVRKIAFVPVLSDWLADGVRIGGVLLNGREWFNVGSRAEYLAVHRFIRERSWRPSYLAEGGWPAAAVGVNSRIGEDVVLENTVVWDDAEIASGSRLSGCIVRDHCRASGIHIDKDF